MASKDEFRAYMKAATEEIEGRKGPCPEEAQLIAYYNGAGDANAREAIASHLTVCAACRETLLDIPHFFNSAHERESAGLDLDREWRRFAAASATSESVRGARRTWFQWPMLAWASLLGVVILSAVSWFWMQGRLRSEIAAAQQRAGRLEQENRSLRASRESELAAATRPRLDSALFDLYPRDALDRSGGPRRPKARLSAAAPAMLILNGAGQAKHPAYAIDIFDSHSRAVWHGDGLVRHPDGAYGISFPAGFLRAGDYVLSIFGVTGGARVKLAEYEIAVADR
jgi:hypothetical protein